MKKYFIGSAALLLALSLSAFNFFRVNVTFDYNTVVYSQTDVQSTTNYIPGAITCENSQVPCSITVPAADCKTVNGATILDPAKVTISATDPDADGNYKINSVSVSTGTATFTNKNLPNL